MDPNSRNIHAKVAHLLTSNARACHIDTASHWGGYAWLPRWETYFTPDPEYIRVQVPEAEYSRPAGHGSPCYDGQRWFYWEGSCRGWRSSDTYDSVYVYVSSLCMFHAMHSFSIVIIEYLSRRLVRDTATVIFGLQWAYTRPGDQSWRENLARHVPEQSLYLDSVVSSLFQYPRQLLVVSELMCSSSIRGWQANNG